MTSVMGYNRGGGDKGAAGGRLSLQQAGKATICEAPPPLPLCCAMKCHECAAGF
jgi:hypothetical protein